jgi:DNA-binding transcriptional ArsR family regulator
MGASKSEHFSEEQNQIAKTLKALAHPARIAIIEHLLEVESCICGEIVSQLPLSQPTVSQHLRELKNVGLIKGSIEGNRICYCIDTDALARIQMYFTALRTKSKATQSSDMACC